MQGSEKLIMPALETKEKPQKEIPISNVQAEYDKELFGKLRALRKQIADKMEVPPFVIFGNAALQDMARRRPRDEEEFLKVNGVGTIKLKQFGKQFLQAINNFKIKENAKI
jgi:Superfamily II DNA helicase